MALSYNAIAATSGACFLSFLVGICLSDGWLKAAFVCAVFALLVFLLSVVKAWLQVRN